MIVLTPHREGVLLGVRAQPGARRNEIRGEHEGLLKVCVTQIAEKGKANRAIIEQLCKSLKLRKSQCELVSGDTAAQKRFLIRDITADDLRGRLDRVVGLAQK